MRLTDAWIHGLRRFGGDRPHRVRCDTKLVCLIGANEAGKSTVLDALDFAHKDEPIAASDRTRREEVPEDRQVIRLRYRLDDDDRQALSEIVAAEPPAPHWFDVFRLADGTRQADLNPTLLRDRSQRLAVAERLQEASHQWWPKSSSADGQDEGESSEEQEAYAPDLEQVQSLREELVADREKLPSAVLETVSALAGELADHDEELAQALQSLASFERQASPWQQAVAILLERMPRFVRFDQEARELQNEYDLTAAAENPGSALENLAALAELDLRTLRDVISSGETGTVHDLREAANATLARRFAAWTQQPPVKVVLDTDGMLLRIHVQSGTGPTMPVRQRSDGLRQFVALIALASREQANGRPILLIDEVEEHLHYDAQADLIGVLSEQDAAAQVIYTTHSAASLPDDLGLGVRVVEGLGELTASRVRQNFWRDEHPGMTALLMAMGAASLAYVPLRPAVIAEGGTELVLLATLMREAIAKEDIGLAVVPGSSSTPPERIAGLDLQGVRTLWVLDADDAGRKRRDELIDDGIPAERVVMLASEADLEIEDLIEPGVYCKAVKLYLDDVSFGESFGVEQLPAEPCRRHEVLQAWCEEHSVRAPGKIAIANKVIDLAGEHTLLDASYSEHMRDLHARCRQLLKLPEQDS